MPAGLKIDVTAELIAGATQRDSRRCMVAEAVKVAGPHLQKVMVDLQTIRWTNPRTRKRYIVLTPEAVGLALVAFDQGEAVEPFAVRLVPVQVTAAPTRPSVKQADGTPSRPRGTGRKRLSKGGVTEGGRPLPTGHLSNVQVSRNDVRVYGRRLLRA